MRKSDKLGRELDRAVLEGRDDDAVDIGVEFVLALCDDYKRGRRRARAPRLVHLDELELRPRSRAGSRGRS